jgi:DNA invertase Pin-like site-specific DNA recombinase
MDKQVAVNEAGYRIGEDHQNAKLTDHEVALILELREECMSYAAIAEKFGIGKSTVADICKGRRRCQCAFRWKRQSKRKVRVSKD